VTGTATTQRRRARSTLTARRRLQDRSVDAAARAVAARDDARARMAAAEVALSEAVTGLAGMGLGRDELAALLGLPPGALDLVGPDTPAAGPPRVLVAEEDAAPEGALRIWLGMYERGSSPRTHALGTTEALLCGRRGDPRHRATWIGYAFDVDCAACARELAGQLTEEQFG
jgi:hypothetical protein